DLTGLANRRAYNAAVARFESAAEGPKVSVLLIDVDHFKAVNDTFGHGAGDEVLRRIGAILRRVTRATDVAARLGGDEFVVLIPGGLYAAKRAAHDVLEVVGRHDWAEVAAAL